MTEENEAQIPGQGPGEVSEQRIDKSLIGASYLRLQDFEPNNIAAVDITPFVMNQAPQAAPDAPANATDNPN